MPIYEFRCRKCNNKFEELISSVNNSSQKILCPKCGTYNPERLMSTFNSKGMSSDASCSSCTSNSCSSCSS